MVSEFERTRQAAVEECCNQTEGFRFPDQLGLSHITANPSPPWTSRNMREEILVGVLVLPGVWLTQMKNILPASLAEH